MSDIRKMVNPHDEITIDCTDIDAARIAVLVVGMGAYCIENDEMPLFVFGGAERWFSEKYGMDVNAFIVSVSRERVAAAMESMTLIGYQTSLSDPVSKAHRIAASIRTESTPAPEPGTESDE
jgi:hypothetical protein